MLSIGMPVHRFGVKGLQHVTSDLYAKLACALVEWVVNYSQRDAQATWQGHTQCMYLDVRLHNRAKFNGELALNNHNPMKYRPVTLSSGQTFQVPQGIQRIDSKSTHGWQVRYQGSKFFSDGPHGGPHNSLKNAILELLARVTTMPAPAALNRGPNANKTSDLPSGISGPIVRARPGRAMTAELSVLLPRFGQRAQYKNIYIGSQNTYTEDKYREALAKGLAIRNEAIERYELDAAKARRASATGLRAQISALRSREA